MQYYVLNLVIECGESQVAGVNFSENYSPAVKDIMVRVLLLIWIHFGFAANVVNFEMAFLYGVLDENSCNVILV